MSKKALKKLSLVNRKEYFAHIRKVLKASMETKRNKK